jgi:hypothetical protein
MDQQVIETYCRDNGVPFKAEGERLRVMDVTLLPMAMREACDERGFVREFSGAFDGEGAE